uniref:Ribosomal protein L19 n=1 Tax=Boodleopsis pusilla TaxID=381415 RepID=A0A386AZJ3_9CHLO|nr:ribosomal protein L19 [Boodleopsis pusilla]AYC64866.1 ribosomal protein L19 [Boodleopsis pusilla]
MVNPHEFLQHFDSKNARAFDPLSIGDWIKVGFLVQENEKKRLQFFEGLIIAIKGPGKKVTLRTAGIERIFCCQSPHLQTLTLLKPQASRRSKLYYVRQRVGKKSFWFKKMN